MTVSGGADYVPILVVNLGADIEVPKSEAMIQLLQKV